MTDLPDLPINAGKRRRAKDLFGSYSYFTVLDEITMIQSTNPQKAIYLQRIQFDDQRIEFRLGYYIIGKKPKHGWEMEMWGQFATMLPADDFTQIVLQARNKGWIE